MTNRYRRKKRLLSVKINIKYFVLTSCDIVPLFGSDLLMSSQDTTRDTQAEHGSIDPDAATINVTSRNVPIPALPPLKHRLLQNRKCLKVWSKRLNVTSTVADWLHPKRRSSVLLKRQQCHGLRTASYIVFLSRPCLTALTHGNRPRCHTKSSTAR